MWELDKYANMYINDVWCIWCVILCFYTTYDVFETCSSRTECALWERGEGRSWKLERLAEMYMYAIYDVFGV